jgi:predicted Ser/Thr protein kinase
MNTTQPNPSMPEASKCPQCGAALPAGALAGLCPACLLQQGAADSVAEPAESFVPPSPAELARFFPQLEILELLGRGGMGAVYKARQKELDRFVAVKILPPSVSADPAFSERFAHEARALAKLNHQNIVTLYEFGQTDGLYFFLMEFVDGMSLRQLLHAGRIAPREALAIVPQICDALQYAHDAGIVHRDIKPENILLDRRGRVKVADFGLAKLISVVAGRDEPGPPASSRPATGDLTEAGKVIGTPQYMAPEQIERPSDVDHRADIYALGVVFYQMLTGELPTGRFEPPSKKVVVDVRLDEVVLRALEKRPARRYQQISEVKTVVETIAATGGADVPPGVPGASSSPGPAIALSALAPGAPVSAAEAAAYSNGILSRECTVNIGSCFRRGFHLVAQDFWRVVAVTAFIALISLAVSSTLLGLVVFGPLVGGLWLYYLKRIRGERSTLRMAFSGFDVAFTPLFLITLVGGLLTILGFLCLALPGIYLLVAWIFATPLAVDQRLDFWAAMKLSLQAVSKHWWKVFGFLILLTLLIGLGLLLFYVGVLVALPIAMAALAYAYEDIFGSKSAVAQLPATGRRTGRVGKVLLVMAALVLALIFLAFVDAIRKGGAAQDQQNQGRGDEQIPAAQEPSIDPVSEPISGWSDLAAEGLLLGGVTADVDGRTALKIENTNDTPLQLALFKMENPPITSMWYTVTGELKCENVQGAGYLEMWSCFPPPGPGMEEGRFFSRTLGAAGSGPMGQITGTSSWRAFTLPFDRTGTTNPPSRLELNVFLPGRGVVFLGPVRLVQKTENE